MFLLLNTTSNIHAVVKILTEQVKTLKTPSVQYIFFDKDTILYRFHSGFADIKNRVKTDDDTTYHAFSVTKTFTALAILQLAEQNKLDIDKPVKNYLPGFSYGSSITIRQVLTHSAGIPNPIPLSWIHLASEHSAFDRNHFFQQIFAKHHKVKAKPNETFAYSNLGYVILGQLIEQVSGLRYEEFIRKNILAVLGIQPGALDFIIHDTHLHAKGYHKRFSVSNALLGLLLDKSKYLDTPEDGWNVFKDNYVNGASYGGLIGTAQAFMLYIQELLQPGCRLITDEYKALLFKENVTHAKKRTGMCLSWFSGLLNGKRFFTHAGGGGGYYCEIRIYPDEGKGSVLMFNRTGFSDERFLDRLDTPFILTH